MEKKKTITKTQPRPRHDYAQTALVLQGGGALGAYQGGVYERIAETHHMPTWLIGVSIGAINSGLIAGSPPERRVEHLHAFWDLVSSGLSTMAPRDGQPRSAYNRLSAWWHASVGVPGFYRPHAVPSFLHPRGSKPALSFYDTSWLRETLLRFIDFDLINSKAVRLSVGAVNIRSGNSQYFDNFERTITPEHIMASGALPPAFAPIEIDGEAYWDGGIVSNTPLQYLLDMRGQDSVLALQVDLFPARGAMPVDMSAVLMRQKDIMYSSRTRYSTDMAKRHRLSNRTLRALLAKLPAAERKSPEIAELETLLNAGHVDIVHLIYRSRHYEQESKDYEFSRAYVLEHWASGLRDMSDTLEHPEWLARSGLDESITTYDLTRPETAHKESA